MNFLAHALLAYPDEDLLIGNFIADAVKGNPSDRYSPAIVRGIVMHRAIDAYTDNHPIVLQAIQRLRPRYSKYAGVLIDIYFDHFLAKNWSQFHPQSLREFTQDLYSLMNRRLDQLPAKTQEMLPYMVKYDWLTNYQHLEGIQKVLAGMSKRTKFVSNLETGAEELVKNYETFQDEFLQFFPQIQQQFLTP